MLNAVNEVVSKECPQLALHLRENSLAPQVYAWPILRSFFTEVLAKEDWLKLVDHLFAYKEDPELVVYFCAAFVLQSKGSLMSLQSIEELHNFQQS